MAAGLAVPVALTAACNSSDSGGTPEEYPTGPITLIVPWKAGSGPDSTARALVAQLEDQLGQSFVVENKEGGSGTIGLSELADADPDGYTISWMASPALTMQWQRIDTPFEGPDQVAPIAQVVSVVSMLFTNSAAGIETIDDLVQLAGDSSVAIGLPNEGSQQDLAVRLLAEAAGVEFDLNYFGGGQQVLPVVNGTVYAGVAQAAPVVQYVERGDLSWVGVLGSAAPAGIDAPLIGDSYDLDNPALDAYEGLVAPAGTSEVIIKKLAEAVQTAIESDGFQEFINSTYGVAQYVGPEELQTKIDDGVAAASELIEKYGL